MPISMKIIVAFKNMTEVWDTWANRLLTDMGMELPFNDAHNKSMSTILSRPKSVNVRVDNMLWTLSIYERYTYWLLCPIIP